MITITKDLKERFAALAKIIPPKPLIDAYSNVFLEIDSNRSTIKFHGGETEQYLSFTIPAVFDEQDYADETRVVGVYFKEINKFIQKSKGDISLEISESNITFSTVKNTITLPTVSEDKCYDLFSLKGKNSQYICQVSDEMLFKVNTKVCPFVSTDISRPSMTGVHIHTVNNKLCFEAIDGFHGARLEFFQEIVLPVANCIVPTIFFDTASKLGFCSMLDLLIVEDRHIALVGSDITLVSLLIDETYPPFDTVLNFKSNYQLTANANIIQEDITIPSIIAETTISKKIILSPSQSLAYTHDDETLKNATAVLNVGEIKATDVTAAEMPHVCNVSFCFNLNYLLDVVKALNGDTLIETYLDLSKNELYPKFDENGNPVRDQVKATRVFTFTELKPSIGSKYIALIMPIKM